MDRPVGDAVRIVIVIPVYNHGKTLRRVAEQAVATGCPVMVVDDGSSDDGIASLAGLDLVLLTHGKNRGKGVAIRTAAVQALKMGMTHMVTLDADGQHDVADFPRFVSAIQGDPKAIFVGKRRFNMASDPKSSIHGRSFSNFWFRLQTGKRVGDAQSGYRAYPLYIFEALMFREPRYSFEVEVLVKSAWAGVRVGDVDISVYYPPGKERISHFDLFLDNLRLTHLNAKLTARSLIPFPHRKIAGTAGKPADDSAKISLRHPLSAIKALLAESATPRELAAAGAMGVFLGALPLIACHTLAILLTAGFFRLNRVVAVSTSQLCMPPIVPALCIEAGYYLRHGRFLTEISLETVGYQGLERIFEWLVGSLFVGPVLAGIVGGFIYITAWVLRRKGWTPVPKEEEVV